jgi:hypothetical protein
MASAYIIPTGQFVSPAGVLVCTCYAGHAPNIDNVAAVGIKNSGPLPPGRYQIGVPFDHPLCGPFSMRLEPEADPLSPHAPFAWLLGRSGFLIHADLVDWAQHPESASDGCVVPYLLPSGVIDGRACREAINAIREAGDDMLDVRTV